ncbi:hypothetical protein [Salinisphaera sp. SWV1]|uniref:hypothetical protein n=1 Tax=Salinisphaera sp. SWV1 TaxID=3454139 RepID=UPI003F8626BA
MSTLQEAAARRCLEGRIFPEIDIEDPCRSVARYNHRFVDGSKTTQLPTRLGAHAPTPDDLGGERPAVFGWRRSARTSNRSVAFA